MSLRLAAVCAVVGLFGCHRAPPSAGLRPIGAPCARDADCGAGFHCATDHPGGYCELACRGDGDCPAGAVCVGGDPISRGDCHRRCDGARAGDCRAAEGYRCIAGARDAAHDYCDPPGRSDVARRLRGGAWRW